MSRKFIAIYLVFLLIFSSGIYIFISFRKAKLFSVGALESMILTPSLWRSKYTSPCDMAINGDPSVGDNWVKISFHCPNGVKTSTMALTVFENKSWSNIMEEYARIIGFSPEEILRGEVWSCYIDRKELVFEKEKEARVVIAENKDSLDCVGKEERGDYLLKYYGNK